MALDIIPKAQGKPIFASQIVFVAGILLLLGAVAGFAGFWRLQQTAKTGIQNVQNLLNAGVTLQDRALEKEILQTQKKVRDFNALVKTRQDSSRFFVFLEQYAHPKVSFTSIELNAGAKTAILQGEAPDFITLDQQILTLKQRPELNSVDLTNVAIALTGKVVFGVTLSFNDSLFK